MAGSDKLYLQPILKDLLDGLNTSMQSIDGIVDGLGDAVADMKSAVDVVTETVDTVSETLNTTNTKLETVNTSVKNTEEYVFGENSTLKDIVNPYASYETFATGRFEQGDVICSFVPTLSGVLVCQFAGYYSAATATMNCGVKFVDLSTGIGYFIIDHVPTSNVLKIFRLPVNKNTPYAFICDYPGGEATTPNDIVIGTFGYKATIGKLNPTWPSFTTITKDIIMTL